MKNVSEPILTIINLLKEQPERFTFTLSGSTMLGITVVVEDTLTKLAFSIHIRLDSASGMSALVLGMDWATDDEQLLLGAAARGAYGVSEGIKKEASRKVWYDAYCNKD